MSKSASPKSKSASASNATALKELQKRVEELSVTIDQLKHQNEQLKSKLKIICKKLTDNVDMSQYSFISEKTPPDEIDLNDILHMIQTLALLASQVSSSDNIENHVEALEIRISELSKENSNFFKNKLKLQERIDFIMQERDVWKRNAETLKQMYAKLVKEQELKSTHVKPASATSTAFQANKCVIGSYRANVDPRYPNQRAFSATIPKDYLENLRTSNITSIQLNTIDQNIITNLDKIQQQQQQQQQLQSQRNTNNNYNTFENLDKLNLSSPTEPIHPLYNHNNFYNTSCSDSFGSIPNTDSEHSFRMMNNFAKSSNDKTSSPRNLIDGDPNNSSDSITEIIERQNTSNKKNVSFNKDIDVRVFRKNSKNSKIFESFMLPLPQHLQEHQQHNSADVSPQSPHEMNAPNQMTRNFLPRPESVSEISPISSFTAQKQTTNLNGSINLFNYAESSRHSSRGSVCSKRKLPGETPVKELDPTLKMIIIKELSAEKIDGNDWRMFAKRIGLSDNEIRDWINLKLQFPMARVLSFWSARPEASVRVLHRHLNAPCFNYGPLAKRLENFYDVI